MSVFDIQKPPPTERELDERRTALETAREKLVLEERRAWLRMAGIVMLAAATLLWLWLEVRLPGDVLARVIAIVGAVAFAGIVAFGSYVVALFAGVITVGSVVVVAVALAAGSGLAIGPAIVVAAISVGVGVTVGAVVGIIEGPDFEARAELIEESIRMLRHMELTHCPEVVKVVPTRAGRCALPEGRGPPGQGARGGGVLRDEELGEKV